MWSKDIYAVVMAGGKGERFWPQSRTATPKPLLRLVGDLTLIEMTIERIKPFVIQENIIIVTNREYVPTMQSLFSEIPPENIIGEPIGKDTAPCLALAAGAIAAKNPNSNPVMIVLPADHIIKDATAFNSVLNESVELASKGYLVTFGINPTCPSTGFGYIRCGDRIKHEGVNVFNKVVAFKEKPDLNTATQLLKDGNYKWNSGIFVWSLSTIANAFKKFCPELSDAFDSFKNAVEKRKLDAVLEEIYPGLKKISIDYALIEKADNLIVAEWKYYWDDVGSWTALRNQTKPDANQNFARGLHFGIDTDNCIIVSDNNHLISTVDIKDLIIVHTGDVTLVCNAQSAQKVKDLVNKISQNPELSKFL
jgi:mannose-1-phosphate guanylyltransferase